MLQVLIWVFIGNGLVHMVLKMSMFYTHNIMNQVTLLILFGLDLTVKAV